MVISDGDRMPVEENKVRMPSYRAQNYLWNSCARRDRLTKLFELEESGEGLLSRLREGKGWRGLV